MLRILSAILFFLALILFLIFWMENYEGFGQVIKIRYEAGITILEPVEIPVWVLMILSFIAGILITFLLELTAWFKTRSKISEQNKTIRRMEKELQDLRTLPFTDAGAGGETVTSE